MNTSSAHVVVEAARPEDAVSIVDIQRRTWYATYPNKQFGITVADLREQLEGADGELVAKRVERWRQWIETGSDMRAIYMARLNGKTVGYATPAIVVGQRQVAALYILTALQIHADYSYSPRKTNPRHSYHIAVSVDLLKYAHDTTYI